MHSKHFWQLGLLLAALAVIAGGFYAWRLHTQKTLEQQIADYFNAGNFDAAEQLLATSKVHDATYYLDLSTIYAQKGSLRFQEQTLGQKAVDAANQGLAIDAQSAPLLEARGYAYEIMNDFAQASSSYIAAMNINPMPSTYAHYAHLSLLEGDVTGAATYYQDAFKLDPTYDLARLGYAKALMLNHQYHDAAQFLENSVGNIANKRTLAAAYQLLGANELALSEFSAAQDSFMHAEKADPTLATAYSGLASATFYMLVALPPAAFVKIFPSAAPGILAQLQKANKIDPNQASTYLLIGKVMQATGNTADAKTFYQKAISLAPNDITLSTVEKKSLITEASDLIKKL